MYSSTVHHANYLIFHCDFIVLYRRWPVALNPTLFEYMYNHPLPAGGHAYIGAPTMPYPNVIAELTIPEPLLEYQEIAPQTASKN